MKRNLVYFICPLARGRTMYRENLESLIPNIVKFNGKRIVMIAQGEGIDPAQDVINYFQPELNIDFRIVENDPILCETPHFFAVLKELYSLDKDEVTFYAHAKGARWSSEHDNKTYIHNIRKWRNRMYKYCLQDIDLIERELKNYACVGSFRRSEDNEKVHGAAKWHYSGTFFWFNHFSIFSCPEYEFHKENRCGVESWLGHHIDIGSSSCVYCDLDGQNGSVYRFTNSDWERNDSTSWTKDLKKAGEVSTPTGITSPETWNKPIRMTRTKVINMIARENGARSYLEIGVRDPADNFNKIEVENKIGVDIDPRSKAKFIMTSDVFFTNNNQKFDIIFIDGDHTYEQSKRDMTNALKVLNENGVIVCHDVYPMTENEATSKQHSGPWCGEVYRAFAEVLARPGVSGFAIKDDHGVGVLVNGQSEGRSLPIGFSVDFLHRNPDILNLAESFEQGWDSIKKDG